MSFIASLLRHARERPDDRALWHAGRWLSWHEVLELVVNNAQRLSKHPPGTRVVTTFANDASAVIGALALQAVRHVEIPLGNALPTSEVNRLADRSGATYRLCTEEINLELGNRTYSNDQLAKMLSEFDPSDVAMILWTSGTTAVPRGVVMSAGALAANAAGKLQALRQNFEDRRLTVLPLWHSYARTCDLGTWLLSGCALAVTSGWDGMHTLASDVRPTLMSVVPSLVKRLLADSDNGLRDRLNSCGLDQLRVLSCGGAALHADDYRKLTQAGLCVIHGYGLTEAGPVICSATPSTAVPGMVGCPIADTEIRIDSNGELFARGPGMMIGYLDDPQATAEVFADGWLRTGDLAQQRSDGIVRILGRSDDTIVCSNGKKIQPLEIEQRLQRSPNVRSAVLWQDTNGDLVAIIEGASLSGPPNGQQAELEKSLCELPAWKRPSRWVFLPVPLNASELTSKGTPRRKIVAEKYGIECQ